jgi:hypothetical protein
MICKLVLLVAILALAAPALAGVSPHEVVLTIPYGNAPGELDTLRVDGDDPFHTLVQSFVIEVDETVWVLPRVEVAGRTVLYAYNNNSFTRELPFTGYPMGFLRTAEGVYSWTAGGNRAVSALVAFDPGPGRGDVRRAELPAGDLTPSGFDGWMGLVDGSACLFGRVPGNQVFTVRIGNDLPAKALSDVVRGVCVSGSSGPVWQDTKLIRRGDEVLHDLGLMDGGLVYVLPDGGFVIRLPGEKDGEKFNPRFQIYDAQGNLMRNIETLPRTDKFAVGTFPWFFTTSHCYQMLLGKTEGRLVRY